MGEHFLSELKETFASSKYWNKVGLNHEDLAKGYSKISINLIEENLNMSGNLHGGIMMSALDIGMGLATRTLGPKKVSTIQMEVRFLQEINSGNVYAECKVIHLTKNTAVIEGKIINEVGDLIAFSTSTFKLFW